MRPNLCIAIVMLLPWLQVLGQETVPSDVSFDSVLGLNTSKPNASYRYGETAQQYAELWLPKTPSPPGGYPVVVLVHGGCWLNSFDVGHLGAANTALAEAGFAVWATEYRRVGDAGGGWPGSLKDIDQSLETMAELSKKGVAPLDLQQVALAGHSAGGHLALLASANPPAEINVKSTIGLAAITDIEKYAGGSSGCEKSALAFMGGPAELLTDDYAKANPTAQPTPHNTQLLMGSQDTIVKPPQGSLPEAKNLLVPGAGHFDFIHPGTQAWATFISVLETAL